MNAYRILGFKMSGDLPNEEVTNEIGMTIESIDNIEIAKKLSKKYNVEMPIVNAAYDVLYGNLKPEDAVTILMNRTKKFENE